jgi:hypothetical protein
MTDGMKTPEDVDKLELLAASYACDYRDSPKSNVPPDSHLVYSVAYDAFLAGYKAAQPQWINVKERLPEMNELCIVNTEWRGVVTATYGNESWIFDEGQGSSEKALSYVSHWMPLPEPPMPKPPKDAKE